MKKIQGVLLAAGIVGFAFLAAKVGRVDLLHQLRVARTGSFLLIGFGLLRLALQTAAWSTALRAQGIRQRVSDLVWIRLAAQSIGYFSVLGPAVAEPMKIRLLPKKESSGMVATLADAGTYGFTSCLIGILGCVCALLVMVHRQHVAPLIVLAAGLITWAIFCMRSKPLLASVIGCLGSRAPHWLVAIGRAENEIRRFGGRHRGPVRRMLALNLGCQLLLAGDIVVVFWCLGIPSHAATVLAIEAASRAARMMAGWVPARIGVDEAGAVAAFAAFGLPSASGLALALARRIRDLSLGLLGIGLLLWKTRWLDRLAGSPVGLTDNTWTGKTGEYPSV